MLAFIANKNRMTKGLIELGSDNVSQQQYLSYNTYSGLHYVIFDSRKLEQLTLFLV